PGGTGAGDCPSPGPGRAGQRRRPPPAHRSAVGTAAAGRDRRRGTGGVRAAAAGCGTVRPPVGGGRMSAPSDLGLLSIQQQCKQLRLPAMAGQSGPLAQVAERERHSYLGYLEALLAAEVEERKQHTIARRIQEAHFPRVKTLEEFDFREAPAVSPT